MYSNVNRIKLLQHLKWLLQTIRIINWLLHDWKSKRNREARSTHGYNFPFSTYQVEIKTTNKNCDRVWFSRSAGRTHLSLIVFVPPHSFRRCTSDHYILLWHLRFFGSIKTAIVRRHIGRRSPRHRWPPS